MNFSENGLFHFVAFINSGVFGFDGFWAEAADGIRRAAQADLRKRLVLDRFNQVDPHAVADVEDTVFQKLRQVAERPGPAAFDPGQANFTPVGLSKWLRRVVANCVIDWCRKFHGARPAVKTVSLDDLPLNGAVLPAADHKNLLDALIRSEQIEKVRLCLNKLGREDRFWLEQTFFEGLSQRALASKLDMPSATVFRRVTAAKERFLVLFTAA
ncbi:MAG: RNA polymerase sigma factor [Planctomycetia bacterium]